MGTEVLQSEVRPSAVQSSEVPTSVASSRPVHFLLVEDNPVDAELLERELRRSGFEFTTATVQTPEDFAMEIRATRPDIVLADYKLPQWSGMEALEILTRHGLDVPLILVSGSLGDINAVECIKKGATDYVLKGALTRLPVAVHRALQEKHLRDERKRTEEELAQKVEELARSNRELEQFAYIASHDLKEPLRMVASYTELLSERYQGKLDEKADKYIAYAVDGAKRMQRLINDLLTYARVGAQPRPLQPVDTKILLDSVIKQMETAIKNGDAEITRGELPIVNGDELQLGQVFQNLISNALKFRGERPTKIEVRAELTGNTWRFSVADNGIGIASESSERIFQMFQRLHSREQYEGTGIGLAIVKKVVGHHGGQIWFESVPGQGTTFYFTLANVKRGGE